MKFVGITKSCEYFGVSFEESFEKFWENYMEISYKIHKNLRFIEKILRKFVRNIR